MTTELSLVFPTDAGFTIWVWSAFGAFFGFLVWFLTFASGVLTMVVHPCFIINIVWSLVEPSLRDAGYYGWAKFLAVPLILALVSLNTWMGLRYDMLAMFHNRAGVMPAGASLDLGAWPMPPNSDPGCGCALCTLQIGRERAVRRVRVRAAAVSGVYLVGAVECRGGPVDRGAH